MRRHIDGAYVAAQIRLVRQVHKGSVLILEGETDAKVFDRFIDPSSCTVEIAFGKENALEALDLLEEEGFPGVVAVVDADFDRILGTKYHLENLCITDCHDLDLTIFSTRALDRYLSQYVDKDVLRHKFGNDYDMIRDAVINASLPLACCRLTSVRRNLRLYFGTLKHEEFVDLDDLSVRDKDLTAYLISCSTTRCTVAMLDAYIAAEAANLHDRYQLANGHDVAAILGIALRKLLANRRDVHTWASEVETGLRLAFDWEALSETTLYRCLQTWEDCNKPYRILRRLPL
jgi:hypothetical protein